MHFKTFSIIFMLGWLITLTQGQTGLGGSGTIYYPGFFASDRFNSRFGVGGGYEVFARHKIFKIRPDIEFHARYNYRRYYDNIRLPKTDITSFNFTYLSISVLSPLRQLKSITIYGGLGANMATITAARDFLRVTEVGLLPDIFTGIEWYPGKYYNLFGEISFQYGQVHVGQDNIPLTGLRFSIGATMFFIADE